MEILYFSSCLLRFYCFTEIIEISSLKESVRMRFCYVSFKILLFYRNRNLVSRRIGTRAILPRLIQFYNFLYFFFASSTFCRNNRFCKWIKSCLSKNRYFNRTGRVPHLIQFCNFVYFFFMSFKILLFHRNNQNLSKNRYACDSATFDSILQFYIFFLRVF